jgi:uncharacterized damage-inducible protein DinB
MTSQDLQALFDYGCWANRKLFDSICQLTPEQFTRTVDGSHGSIRNTMVHMLSAAWGWLERCGGPKRGAALSPADYPTFAPLLGTWNQVETNLREFASKLRDEDLARQIEFTMGRAEKYSMPMGELLQHAANHGIHHRGQVSLLLRLLGLNPENFDLLLYNVERRGLKAP